MYLDSNVINNPLQGVVPQVLHQVQGNPQVNPQENPQTSVVVPPITNVGAAILPPVLSPYLRMP